MDYVELNVRVTDPELAEILTAELAELPYESFQTEGEVLKAYIPRERLADCMQQTDDLLARYGIADPALYRHRVPELERLVGTEFHAGRCRWTHPDPGTVPRAAAGLRTGGGGNAPHGFRLGTPRHDLPGRVGAVRPAAGGETRTRHGLRYGVLAIVAAKRGAATVDAVDIDEWAEANCRENAAANGLAERIVPMLGDAGRIAGRKYDFIAANINRNILTMDMPAYAEALDTGGDLLMSGFLEEDVPVIEARARACGLDPIEVRMRDGWAMVHVKKA